MATPSLEGMRTSATTRLCMCEFAMVLPLLAHTPPSRASQAPSLSTPKMDSPFKARCSSHSMCHGLAPGPPGGAASRRLTSTSDEVLLPVRMVGMSVPVPTGAGAPGRRHTTTHTMIA